MTPPAPPVIASFFDRRSRKLSIHPVKVPTGAAAEYLRARAACRGHAVTHGYTHFTMLLAGGKAWGVFELLNAGDLKLVHEAPTQEAAEMWLVHLG